MAYITQEALTEALERLKGTADHLLKIWLVLKQMNMTPGNAVYVTTSSSEDALKRLFDYGHPDGELYVPFAHTDRFMTMKSDAARSIIQTNIRRWASSGSVVTVDPTSYLRISETDDDTLKVEPGRVYPQGLGYGRNGFALEDDARVMIPTVSFGVWYYRQEEFPEGPDFATAVAQDLRHDLHLSPAEFELVFAPDDPPWEPALQPEPLSDNEVFDVVQTSLEEGAEKKEAFVRESHSQYSVRVKSMTSVARGPQWLNYKPEDQLEQLIQMGSKAILLYGSPRTGKTRVIDKLVPRNDETRETIQIHDGWGYDELLLGLRPDPQGDWAYKKGPLLNAIEQQKSCIVLEEINRTEFSQAIGEVFSLIEAAYRGEEHSIRLRNGESFFIPHETLIICTMNTLDRSTEEIDDALFGRIDAIEFPPRVEALYEMLQAKGVDDELSSAFRELFATIQQYYPLGHGYFAPFTPETEPITFYLTRLRPVLQKHLENYRDQELEAIDEKVDHLFG